MDAILQALGGLLLKAVPTFVLVVLLTIYLKHIFFKPLERVLDERYRATEGARKLAEQSLEKAAAKTAEYDAALRHARAEVYQAQEELHRRLAAERAEQVRQARLRSEQAVTEARAAARRRCRGRQKLPLGRGRFARHPHRRCNPQPEAGVRARVWLLALALTAALALYGQHAPQGA